jgi:cbb3-type cytochrome oxidase subunit 1
MLISTTSDTTNDAGIVWLKLSIVYLIVGIAIGIAMGASHNFALRPVHAHMNLLGWTTLALAGLIYSIYPQAAKSRLAKVHFWLYNLALPPMMIALALLVTGDQAAVPVLAAAQMVLAAAVLAFAANLFMNLKPREA